jgi:ferredoxin hydrogenase small subunit
MTTQSHLRLIWLQAGSCGGCTMAALDSGSRSFLEELRTFGVEIVWHPALSEETGDDALALLAKAASGETALDLLCVEGAILRGPEGSGKFNRFGDSTLLDWTLRLAARARFCLAIGACAAFGGVPAGAPNPTDAVGLQYEGAFAGGALGEDYRSLAGLPVINVAGCAPHPGWILETIAAIALGDLGPRDLDALGRPKFFAQTLAHHGCGRNEYYEFKASAAKLSELGCLMEHLGCKATQAVGDCNSRVWNGSGSCTAGGFPCIACTTPGFEAARGFLETAKVAGIPVNLPLDMPKAWFVALAALSKSATPKRVSDNARSDRVVRAPRRFKGPPL